MDITLVTFFFDINRHEWSRFTRPITQYFDSFDNYLKYNHKMIAYVDSRHIDRIVRQKESLCANNVNIIAIDEQWLEKNIFAWSKLQKEREIMARNDYKNLLSARVHIQYPENTKPEYTILTHSKIDFVNYTIEKNISDTEYYMWSDFGLLDSMTDTSEHYPTGPLSLNKFNKNTINLNCMNPIDNMDRDVTYTLINAPEKLMGGTFFGNTKNLKQFQQLYHKHLEIFQANNIADDEQHIFLRCYFDRPELFTVNCMHGKWRMCLKHYCQ